MGIIWKYKYLDFNISPQQYVLIRFLDEVTIQDFPLRGKLVYLHIRRRRWTNKTTGEIIKRDWTLVAKGTRMTQEFAAFLKEINR